MERDASAAASAAAAAAALGAAEEVDQRQAVGELSWVGVTSSYQEGQGDGASVGLQASDNQHNRTTI